MSGLILNEDNSHFFSFHAEEEMTEAGLDAWADQYAGSQVREIVLCLNSQRSNVPSRVRQTVWDGYDPQASLDQPFFAGMPNAPLWPGGPNARQQMRNWVHHAHCLHELGIDPYERWIRRFRHQGISPWIGFRMNDVHYADQPEHPIHDRFWREHPEFRRCPEAGRYEAYALDFGRPEVRDYALGYVREMIARYDANGIELDWMRFPFQFRPGDEEASGRWLTEFMREVRALARAREKALGHAVRLAVRVPTRPETARELGLDAVHWACEGLVDAVTVAPFLYSEFDMPLETWKRLLGDSGVLLAAGLELTAGYDSSSHTLETARGAAAAFLWRGADRVALFNMMDRYPLGVADEAYQRSAAGQAYARLLREVGDLSVLAPLARRHLFRWPDTYAVGEPPVEGLPRACPAGAQAAFRVSCGPAPLPGQRVAARLAGEGTFAVSVNGVPCLESAPIALAADFTMPTDGFAVPEGVLHEGSNVVEVKNIGPAPGRLTWLEIAISDARGRWAAPADIEAQPFYPTQ